ncbi:MAG: endonuclease III [Deltaproteobacteria bacterium]|nr:endonuclease III [Deltaproteobacteria bacterium]
MALKVLGSFSELYPDPKCGLERTDPFGLLVATILSAQCTDARVNRVAPVLLEAFPGPGEMSEAPLKAIEDIVRSCGFFRMKAKNIKAASGALMERYAGKVPRELDELVTLPGVGRKTANCVMGNAYGLPGITVDTHLGRVSRRLGLTANTDPVKVELELKNLLPEEAWTRFSHQAIAHGRAFCHSRKPSCDACPLGFCPYPRSAAGKPAASPKKTTVARVRKTTAAKPSVRERPVGKPVKPRGPGKGSPKTGARDGGPGKRKSVREG